MFWALKNRGKAFWVAETWRMALAFIHEVKYESRKRYFGLSPGLFFLVGCCLWTLWTMSAQSSAEDRLKKSSSLWESTLRKKNSSSWKVGEMRLTMRPLSQVFVRTIQPQLHERKEQAVFIVQGPHTLTLPFTYAVGTVH
eukprot:scpid40753/ scgid0404/ 